MPHRPPQAETPGPCTSGHPCVAALISALGLGEVGRIRSLTLTIRAGEAIVVEVESFPGEVELGRAAEASRRFHFRSAEVPPEEPGDLVHVLAASRADFDAYLLAAAEEYRGLRLGRSRLRYVAGPLYLAAAEDLRLIILDGHDRHPRWPELLIILNDRIERQDYSWINTDSLDATRREVATF